MEIRQSPSGPTVDVALKSDIVQTYWPTEVPSTDVPGHSILSLVPVFGVESVNSVTLVVGDGQVEMQEWVTVPDLPDLDVWAGILLLNTWSSCDVAGVSSIHYEFLAYHEDTTTTLLMAFDGPTINSPDLVTLQADFLPEPILSPLPLNPKDRLMFHVYAQTTSVVPVTVHWVHNGIGHGSYTLHVP